MAFDLITDAEGPLFVAILVARFGRLDLDDENLRDKRFFAMAFQLPSCALGGHSFAELHHHRVYLLGPRRQFFFRGRINAC